MRKTSPLERAFRIHNPDIIRDTILEVSSKFLQLNNMQADPVVEACRTRFLDLIGEDGGWSAPVPVPVEASAPAPAPAPAPKAKSPTVPKPKGDGFDSDDPEQVVNEKFMIGGSNHYGDGKKSSGKQATSDVRPAHPKALKGLENRKFREFGLHIGQRSRLDTIFCPWKLVEKYPYLFVGKANSEKVSIVEYSFYWLHD